MSTATTALAGKAARDVRFLDSTIGKKVVMAITGVILVGFVIGHLLGNLQVYLGPHALDVYAEKLKSLPPLLWGTRIVLLISVGLHIWSAVTLAGLQKRARPVNYVKLTPVTSTYASRTMYWSGPILALFIVYHLLHFTTGHAHPQFVEGRVHQNLVLGFQNPLVSASYILAMLMLGMHLYHGVWSMFQTVGVNHPKYTPMLKKLAAAVSAFLVIGNVSIPISVLAGVIK